MSDEGPVGVRYAMWAPSQRYPLGVLIPFREDQYDQGVAKLLDELGRPTRSWRVGFDPEQA